MKKEGQGAKEQEQALRNGERISKTREQGPHRKGVREDDGKLGL